MASQIDPTKPTSGNATTESVRQNFAFAKSEIEALQAAAAAGLAMTGEVKLWPLDTAPSGWHNCDGTLLSVATYPDLFAILGTTYGGDGTVDFGIPDMRSRMPIGAGTGTGLSTYTSGDIGGSETTTLTTDEMPAHTHEITSISVTATAKALSTNGNTVIPTGNSFSKQQLGGTLGYTSLPTDVDMKAGDIQGTASGTSDSTGAGTSANTISPYFAINFIICLNGI